MKKIIATIAMMIVVVAGTTFGTGAIVGGSAYAGADPSCADPSITITDSPAYDETIHHDAITHTVHHDAVPPVYGPDLWWNFSPNHHQGPYVGPPDFPNDPNGTWQGPHENGGPSQDTYGTFQQGQGNGSWFHREHGALITPGQDAWDEIVVDVEAWDEIVHHDAVTHEEANPDYPCVTDTPTTPTTEPTSPTTEPTSPTTEPTNPTTEPTNPTTPPTDNTTEPTPSEPDTPNTDEPNPPRGDNPPEGTKPPVVENRYTCTKHIIITRENGVVVDRKVIPIANTCGDDVAEEGF